ncbi:MAG: hypothetical protein JWL76_382 [Thermoleophilia bacterium]|nr:hypothetical protein [Thermoleophilia bacterium]
MTNPFDRWFETQQKLDRIINPPILKRLKQQEELTNKLLHGNDAFRQMEEQRQKLDIALNGLPIFREMEQQQARLDQLLSGPTTFARLTEQRERLDALARTTEALHASSGGSSSLAADEALDTATLPSPEATLLELGVKVDQVIETASSIEERQAERSEAGSPTAGRVRIRLDAISTALEQAMDHLDGMAIEVDDMSSRDAGTEAIEQSLSAEQSAVELMTHARVIYDQAVRMTSTIIGTQLDADLAAMQAERDADDVTS